MIEKDYSGKCIGFSNTTYTLWDCKLENRPSLGPCQVFTYICNISTDFEVCRAKYPDLPINLDLKGHRIVIPYNSKQYPTTVFESGKYEGRDILSCDDTEYLLWVYPSLDADRRDLVFQNLSDKGYCLYHERMITRAEWESIMQEEENLEVYVNMIKQHKPFEIFCSKALDPNGNMDYFGCVIHFVSHRVMVYHGHKYSYPVQKGKVVPIREKMLKIESYNTVEKDGTLYVIPNIWKVDDEK